MPDAPTNLFLYGSLKNPATFRAVTGWNWAPPEAASPGPGFWPAAARQTARPEQPPRVLRAMPATLNGFELVTPDDLYFYAVQRADRRIEGVLLLDVPAEIVKIISAYHGRHYHVRSGRVATGSGEQPAVVFAWAGTHQASEPSAALPEIAAGQRQRNLKAEFAIRARIDQVLCDGQASDQAQLPVLVRARREIRGATIHDLVKAHFQAPGLSEFFIREALSGKPPSFNALRSDPDVPLYADEYLKLLVRQVILNQFERRVFEEHRFQIGPLSGGWRFFEHSVSCLAALRVLSGMGGLLAAVTHDAISELDYHRNDFLDYVMWAINAADNLFEPSAAAEAVDWIASNRTGGLVPLSARVVLSNLRHGSGTDGGTIGFDPAFDSFRYFRAFGLNMLMWKLGGHVLPMPALGDFANQRGMLELALGSTGRRPELAAPVTVDPWVLDRLIGLAVDYLGIQPHSMVLTLRVPRRLHRSASRVEHLPEPVIRCLLALGGDAGPDACKQPRIRRITQREIVTLVPARGLDLIRIGLPSGPNDAFAPQAGQASDLSAHYSFMRLNAGVDNQPIMLAIKGLHLHYLPGEMLTNKQMQAEPALGRLFDSLLAWAQTPTPIDSAERTMFLDAVSAGLVGERRGRPAHRKSTLLNAIDQLDRGIDRFNQMLSLAGEGR